MRSKDGEGSARLRQAEAFPQCRAFAESGAASAACLYDPSREKGVLKSPQAFQNPKLKIFSADDAQSNAARILNRPALGGLHHKIRCFLNAVLRKIPLFQRHPPGGKIRVACALPRL